MEGEWRKNGLKMAIRKEKGRIPTSHLDPTGEINCTNGKGHRGRRILRKDVGSGQSRKVNKTVSSQIQSGDESPQKYWKS